MTAKRLGIKVWNADSVPWSTVQISMNVTFAASGHEDFEAGVDGFCSYTKDETISGSYSGSWTFNREAVALETLVQSLNKFAVARFNDGSVYSHLIGSTGLHTAELSSPEGLTTPVTHTITYAFSGGGDAEVCGPLPDDVEETIDANVTAVATFTQSGNSLSLATGGGLGYFWPGYDPAFDTAVTDTTIDSPVTVTVEDLKDGGSIAFASATASYHYENPNPDYWTDWTYTVSITVTCS